MRRAPLPVGRTLRVSGHCRRANVVPLKCRKSSSASFPYSGQAAECGL